MRYSQDHKAQTHQRIIKEASARFRKDGIGATGLQPLMKALGLTHGGFYSHFKSKDELVEKALQEALKSMACAPRSLLRNSRCRHLSTPICPNGIRPPRTKAARC
jgi:AcrR family transcriptional regulator